MTRTITQQDKELYQCEECGFKYTEKEWAEKCEAWCKEHHSCNLEITSHGLPQETDSGERKVLNGSETKFLTKLFYGLIGFSASLTFFLALYWSLRLNASIDNLIRNLIGTPLYFWPYVLLTLGTIVLFGINVSLFVYGWRKFGPAKIKTQSGTGFGSLVGIAASACPVCGSTVLAAIGIAGGLAAFPLGGLELKALSFGLLALPLWLTRKDLKKLEADCKSGVCPLPKDHSFKEVDRPGLFVLLAVVIALLFISWKMLKTEPIIAKALANNSLLNPNDNQLNRVNVSASGNPIFDEVAAKVLPEKGFPSRIRLSDSIVKLVGKGVIDRQKFAAIYKGRSGFPPEMEGILTQPSDKPILLTRRNANYYVNLLWPLGLANYMSSNKQSPINDKSLFDFASTGGWNLGKEENGGVYFNKFKIVGLTPAQEDLVTEMAKNTYRPCCNNSTFFQDCNHGSALLGLLQLGASQGLAEDELHKEALAFNSFWFPHNYLQTALYLKVVKNTDWEDVDPKVIMGKDFSTGRGWLTTVAQKVNELGLVPPPQGVAACGV